MEGKKMRKAIILSGPIASGKTTIAFGIKDFYELGEWIYTNNHRKAIYYQDLTTFKLVILDECIGLPEIESFEPLREKYPHCNFIFCTQSDIKKVDNDKYNLIGCRPLYKHLVIPDYEHTPPPPPSPVNDL